MPQKSLIITYFIIKWITFKEKWVKSTLLTQRKKFWGIYIILKTVYEYFISFYVIFIIKYLSILYNIPLKDNWGLWRYLEESGPWAALEAKGPWPLILLCLVSRVAATEQCGVFCLQSSLLSPITWDTHWKVAGFLVNLSVFIKIHLACF